MLPYIRQKSSSVSSGFYVCLPGSSSAMTIIQLKAREGLKMKQFIFQGYSDDTFAECKQTNYECYNGGSGSPIWYELKTPDGAGIVVMGIYDIDINKGDGWLIGVSTIDEDKIVDWEIKTNVSHGGYCNQLIVRAPENAKLRCLNRSDDVDNH